MGGLRTRDTTLRLAADLTLQSGLVVEQSFVGTSRLSFTLCEPGVFAVQQIDEDGYVNDYELNQASPLPDITLMTTLPILLLNAGKAPTTSEHQTLYFAESIEAERLQMSRIQITHASATADQKEQIVIKSTGGMAGAKSVCQISQDGYAIAFESGIRQEHIVVTRR